MYANYLLFQSAFLLSLTGPPSSAFWIQLPTHLVLALLSSKHFDESIAQNAFAKGVASGCTHPSIICHWFIWG